MRKKYVLAIFLLVIITVFITTEAEEAKELSLAIHSKSLREKSINDFKKYYPDFGIDISVIENDTEEVAKMLTAFAGRKGPDVFWLPKKSINTFIERGLLLDIQSYIKKDGSIQVSEFPPETLSLCTKGASVYALSYITDPSVAYGISYRSRNKEEAWVLLKCVVASKTIPSVTVPEQETTEEEVWIEQERRIKEAIKSDPNDASLRIMLGDFYFKHDKYQRAFEEYNEAAKIADQIAVKAHVGRGAVNLMWFKIDAAKEEFKKALEINPNDKSAAQWLKQAERAKSILEE